MNLYEIGKTEEKAKNGSKLEVLEQVIEMRKLRDEINRQEKDMTLLMEVMKNFIKNIEQENKSFIENVETQLQGFSSQLTRIEKKLK